MAGRSRDTYKKRQKEVARAEKAKEKAARRTERKSQKSDSGELSYEFLFNADGTPMLNEDGTQMFVEHVSEETSEDDASEEVSKEVVPSLGSGAGQ